MTKTYKQTNPSYHLWGKVKLVNRIITFRRQTLQWIHHDRTLERVPSNQDDTTSLHPLETCKLDTPNKNFFKTVVIKRLWWRCSGIHGDFTIPTPSPINAKSDRAPSSLPHHSTTSPKHHYCNPGSPTRMLPFYSQMTLAS